MAGFTIEPKVRPCLVGRTKRKALFHGFWQSAEWRGSKNGYIPSPMAIVEDEDGGVHFIDPRDIVFVDNKIDEYAFPEEKKEVEKKEDPELIAVGCGGPFDEEV